ncbi:hypothetical protein FBU59_000138 [Linderina macrospora]|uniref:Uncharacterized protein n=1 Tax=Linderina macrospora TaxID=4868 RepID=A0ACC1JHV8_9FUNG|nr:hypothetical protein FBU59_000138 [Linderina macrospora]
MPRQVCVLARFPLLCVAMDGFTPDLCSRALGLAMDIDQGASAVDLNDSASIDALQRQLTALASTKWVSGQLALLIQHMVEYFAAIKWISRCAPGSGGREKPLDTVTNTMAAIADQPLLLAPFMFEVWRDLKPVLVQWVESKKASHSSRKAGSGLEPEYEWAVLVTMRDLVQYEPDRYADQVLPSVYSLLSYTQPSLSASSTALLIDIANICVEANMAGVRSVWATIVKKAAETWTARARSGHAQAVLVLMSLAKFFALVATHGEDTEAYAGFRQEILGDFVEPMCGLPRQTEKPETAGSDTEEAAPEYPLLEPRARDMFLSALSKYPLEEVLPLLSGSTTNQAVHKIVVSLVQQLQEQDDLSVDKLVDRISRSGSCADLLACLMDNEVKFMRRSHITGSSAQGKASAEEDANETADHSQRRSWTRSNFERSQWLNDVLLPALSKVSSEYWNGPAADQLDQVSGYAMAAMMGPSSSDGFAEPGQTEIQTESMVASAVVDRLTAQLMSLIVDASLTDHWCVRNSAADSWSIWFSNAFAAVQANITEAGAEADHSALSTSDRAGATALASSWLFSAISECLRTSHIPAHQANSLFACIGLVKTVAAADTTQGSELAVAVNELLNSTQVLPFVKVSPEEFWVQSAGSSNEEVLAAAVECAGQIARPNSDDTRTLNRVAHFLMSALTLQAEKKCKVAPVVLHSIGRSMIFLHSALDSRKTSGNNSEADTDGRIVVESDDLRRCVERLGIFEPASGGNSQSVVELGKIGLAMSLATMHRHWISRLINPALAEQNMLPRASQAGRLVSQTLHAAFDAVRQVESGSWSQTALASLFYLCFVWPSKPITPRHMELHGSLFAVTPDRVWLTATRLLRKLWGSGGTDDESSGAGGKQSGMRDLELINMVELAYSTLTYHLTMTGGQGAAHATHARLVRQFSETTEGNFGDLELAATEKPSLRANRTVSLAILLGVPVHGVPETTVSNEYLPLAQQNNLPVLLGVGSVQYGSTAWLRLTEQVLQKPLGSLLACSGLLRYLNTDGDGDSAGTAGDAAQSKFVRKVAAVEIDDVRTARIAGVCLSALWAQSLRSMQLLIAEQQDSELVAADDSKRGGEAGQRAVAVPEVVDTATAEEEPQNLSRLPAPTSWCRAFWECLCTLAGSLEDKATGKIVDSIECKLAYLLRSLLQMTRPFPLVDFNGVFTRILQVYLASDRIGSSASAPLPVLWLLVRVASRFSATSYSMVLFLTKAVQSVVGRAVDLALTSPASEQYLDQVGSESLLALAIACVGDIGLGRLLQLSGFVSTSSTAIGDALLARRTLLGKLRTSRTPRDCISAVGTDEVCVSQELASTVASTLPGGESSARMLSGSETEAERMFRVLSKVAIPAQKTANLCASLMSRLQLSAKQGVEAGSPQMFAYQIHILDTFADYIPAVNSTSPGSRQGAVVLSTARQGIVGDLLQVLDAIAQIRNSREHAAVSQRIISATFAGLGSAEAVLGQALDGLDEDRFCQTVEQQSQILRHCWTASAASDHERRRVVGDWLKRLVREWARRGAQAGSMGAIHGTVAWSLSNVATKIHPRGGAHADGARHYAIQAMDMAILAASIVRAASPDTAAASDWIVSLVSVSWLLPILSGVSLSHPESVTEMHACDALVGIASNEMLGLVGAQVGGSGPDRGASIGDTKTVFAEQLRSRMVGLRGLAGAEALQRHLRLALSDLAMLGYVPDVLFNLFV